MANSPENISGLKKSCGKVQSEVHWEGWSRKYVPQGLEIVHIRFRMTICWRNQSKRVLDSHAPPCCGSPYTLKCLDVLLGDCVISALMRATILSPCK
jgi:hypothetical protein